jgi:nitrogen fixation/metabolism regulation signal transduction histidine kinase
MRPTRSLRLRLALLLGLLHLGLATLAWRLWRDVPLVFAAAELMLMVSAAWSWRLVSKVDLHRRLLTEGRSLLQDGELSTRLREVGLEEADALVQLFNTAIDQLRQERIRGREQQAFLERVVEASPLAVLLLDLDERIETINPAGRRLLALEASATGLHLRDLPPPFGPSLEALREDGSTLINVGPRRLKASRARFWDRGFARSFLLIAEVTEELWHSEREAWGRLLRTISHEVNNTAGAVTSLLESCRAELVDPRAGIDVGAALAAGSRRIAALEGFVAGYAEVVRLPPPDRRPLELGKLLDELLLALGPELASRRIAVVWGARRPAWIEADANQLERVVVNVLRNAAEAIGGSGQIEIEITVDDGVARLAITDDGAGIEPSSRDQLFTPFFSTKRDGRGLGLTLVREILAAHQFELALDDAEGPVEHRGARFSLRAPTCPAPTESPRDP